MQAQDRPLFVALCGVAVGFTLLAFATAISAVMGGATKFFEEWQTLIAGVLALAGAVITVGTLVWQSRRERKEHRRVATTEIALQLRFWLSGTMHKFYEASTQQPPNDFSVKEDAFPTPGDIPRFPFESSIATLSILELKHAQGLFELIARKWDAEKLWEHEDRLTNDDDAAANFEERIRAVFLEAHRIHGELTTSLGLSWQAVTEQVVSDMLKRLDELRNRTCNVGLDAFEAPEAKPPSGDKSAS